MRIEQTLLSAVTATGAGSAIGVVGAKDFTAIIKASSVTSGGTVAIETRMPSGAWAAIDSRTISSDGDTIIQFEGPHIAIRGNVNARTDGTYTVGLIGS